MQLNAVCQVKCNTSYSIQIPRSIVKKSGKIHPGHSLRGVIPVIGSKSISASKFTQECETLES